MFVKPQHESVIGTRISLLNFPLSPSPSHPSRLSFFDISIKQHYFDITYAIKFIYMLHMGFPGGSEVKNLPASAGITGDVGLIPV